MKLVKKMMKEPEDMVGPIEPNQVYKSVDVPIWDSVEDVCNYMDTIGYVVVTVRDGIRGSGIDLGYRVLFKRKDLA